MPVTNYRLISGRTTRVLIAFFCASSICSPQPAARQSKLGAYVPAIPANNQTAYWKLDLNGNNIDDGPPADGLSGFTSGIPGEVPVYGDWNGDGRTKIGVYANGHWYVDYNGNGVWDAGDKSLYLGGEGYTAVVGDWNGSGTTKIGVHKDGLWLLDYNGNYIWEGPDVDKEVFFGGPGYTPVVGDWNGSHSTKIGAHLNGLWILDYNGNLAWDGVDVDKLIFFGGPGYTPVVGDWNGSGSTKIGAYLNGEWIVDYNGNLAWDGTGVDKLFFLGGPSYTAIVGDWNGSGSSKVGAYANGLWVLDVNGNFVWDPPIDQVPNFGGLGITPVVGAWKPYDEPQPPAAQRMDFSAPPAAAEGSCGPLATNPNCTRGSSLITFVGQTQMYGTSRTYTTGPDRYKFYNFTSNGIKDQNGSNLGFACGADATSFGDYFAEARVPCSTANFLINVLSSRLYKLDGLHRAQAPGADSGIFHTYYSLGLVAAGSSWDPPSINVGSFSDATTAAGPFVAAGSGGVTARYNSRTQTTVALHIDVPYSAVKGKIDFSFPTVDVYGNASSNQVFSLIVYDDTPHIDTPSPLLAGTQSALTIRGTGFGDHPTVYVDGSGCTGGTAYNPGLPSRINGQDVVTVQVNLPISKAGTSVPVCVKSNGAGGHVFVGAPQGTAQGLPTSNTVQLALQGPPTISGNPGIWWFAGVVPECGDPTVAPCYFTSTLLTVTLGPGGTVPTASAPAVWRPTANESKVSISCTDQSCGSVVVTAVAATVPDCNDSSNQTQIVVTLSGFASPPFYVKVDTPAALEVQQDWVGNVFRPLVTDFPYNANGQIGYTTYIQYFIRSGCGVVMTPIRTNEFFTQNTRSSALFNGVVNNWPFIPNNPINQGFNGVWDVDKFATDNTFTDTIAISDYPPGTAPAGVVPFNPTPQPPPADQSNPGTFMGTSNVWLTWQLQTFRVGSLTQGLGNMVQLGDLVSYLDHARVLPSPPQ